jgi:hypothetical protein
MLKTLAAKHHSTVTKTAARHKATAETSDGLRTCFEARRHREGKPDLVARFGGIPLRQNRQAVIRDPAPARIPYPRKELVRRLRKRICELCETGTTVAVHQVTGLKALGTPGPGQPAWAALMAKNTTQDPHRLRRLPRVHPRNPGRARGINRWKAQCAERVRRLTRRWIAPAGGRGSGGGDLWAARLT